MNNFEYSEKSGLFLPSYAGRAYPSRSVFETSSIVQLQGHFTLRKFSRTRPPVVVADFDNLILDQGLERAASASGSTHIGSVQIGTGSTAPAASQVGLASYSAGTSNGGNTPTGTTVVGGATPYVEYVTSRQFAIGAATGTFSEIGMGWASSGNTLFCRELIRDSGGSPTTITVLSDEALDIEYRFRLYLDTTDRTGTVTLSGTPYDWTLRSASTANWLPGTFLVGGVGSTHPFVLDTVYGSGAVLGAVGGTPTGGATSGTYGATKSLASYVAGSYSRVCNDSLALGAGNLSGGIVCLYRAWSFCAFQMAFSPAIPKTNLKVMTWSHRVTIARRP